MKKKLYNPLRDSKKMHEFFLSIWKKRVHMSEVSGERLSSPPSSAYFHHILTKQKFPEAAFDEENIILLTMDEHASVHLNMEKYEKINNQRDYLHKKYTIFV